MESTSTFGSRRPTSADEIAHHCALKLAGEKGAMTRTRKITHLIHRTRTSSDCAKMTVTKRVDREYDLVNSSTKRHCVLVWRVVDRRNPVSTCSGVGDNPSWCEVDGENPVQSSNRISASMHPPKIPPSVMLLQIPLTQSIICNILQTIWSDLAHPLLFLE